MSILTSREVAELRAAAGPDADLDAIVEAVGVILDRRALLAGPTDSGDVVHPIGLIETILVDHWEPDSVAHYRGSALVLDRAGATSDDLVTATEVLARAHHVEGDGWPYFRAVITNRIADRVFAARRHAGIT